MAIHFITTNDRWHLISQIKIHLILIIIIIIIIIIIACADCFVIITNQIIVL